MKPTIKILGTRGIPANHGGFETFAEKLALYLTGRGWHVDVYCQDDGGESQYEEEWEGVNLVHIPVRSGGALASLEFDFKCALHALKNSNALILTLGYNTAFLSVLYRLFGRTHLMNMDGIEWKRSKWSLPYKIWFYINERLGCWLANHLIADHPEIKAHLATRVSAEKITMIPYGAEQVTKGDEGILAKWGLKPSEYAVLIARPEPENSILEIVQAFSARRRGVKLVVLGKYDAAMNEYHRKVLDAAGPEVVFTGAIYDKQMVDALRHFCVFYVHGHQVGGTNPSLVEALGAGSAVVAHDTCFNRWVAGEGGTYFSSVEHCERAIEGLLASPDQLGVRRQASVERFSDAFKWEFILGEYEQLIMRWHKSFDQKPAEPAQEQGNYAASP